MSRFEAPKQLLEYTLNKYSKYIDNLDIDNLISLIKSDQNITSTNKEYGVIRGVISWMYILVQHIYKLYAN